MSEIRAPARLSLIHSLIALTATPSLMFPSGAHFDLIPTIRPSPLTTLDPPPPAALEGLPGRHTSPTPSLSATTPANRPRRDPKEQSRRRSSRLIEDEFPTRAPIVADEEAYRVLAGVAERHFVDQVRREEVDILASFMCKVKSQAKGAPGQAACAQKSVRFQTGTISHGPHPTNLPRSRFFPDHYLESTKCFHHNPPWFLLASFIFLFCKFHPPACLS